MRQKPVLTSADCHKMMAACIAEAQKNKWAVAIAIVDDSGAALLLERLDGCGAIASPVVMFQGGLPLVHQGECVGAIGVSGVQSHEDEAVAQAGVTALG